MKSIICLFALFALVYGNPVNPVAAPVVPVQKAPVVPSVVNQAPVVEPVVPVSAAVVPAVDAVKVAPVVAEKNAEQAFDEPIEKANKLIIDVEAHIKKYLPNEDEIATTLSPHVYAGDVAESEAERQQNQVIGNLIVQVNRLADSIDNTINSLVAERRYVTAAMLRSMLNYVRRVRVNLERLQNRLQSVQAVVAGQNSPQNPTSIVSGSNIPGTAFINSVRDRINRMTEEIGALVTRIRSTLTPGQSITVTTSPLPPLVTAANLQNIGGLAANAINTVAINTLSAQPQAQSTNVVA